MTAKYQDIHYCYCHVNYYWNLLDCPHARRYSPLPSPCYFECLPSCIVVAYPHLDSSCSSQWSSIVAEKMGLDRVICSQQVLIVWYSALRILVSAPSSSSQLTWYPPKIQKHNSQEEEHQFSNQLASSPPLLSLRFEMNYFVETINVILCFTSVSRAAPDRVYVMSSIVVVASNDAIQLFAVATAVSCCEKI